MAGEHLKKITNKAKQLRAANPNMKWPDAVKKASKLVMPAAKVAGKKKVKKRAVKKAAKKVAVKKNVKKKPHTKWAVIAKHERRVAGVNVNSKRNEIEKELGYYVIAVHSLQKSILDLPIPQRKRAREVVASYKKIIVSLKQNLKLHNDLIKKQLK